MQFVRHIIHPLDDVGVQRNVLADIYFLALAQVGRNFENLVFRWQGAETRECLQHVDSQFAAAGAVLEDRSAVDLFQHFGALPRQHAPEDRRHLGRRNEVAFLTELRRAGRVQRMMHVLGKRDTATRLLDALANVSSGALAVPDACCVGPGQ